jgi:hypothetical protein
LVSAGSPGLGWVKGAGARAADNPAHNAPPTKRGAIL